MRVFCFVHRHVNITEKLQQVMAATIESTIGKQNTGIVIRDGGDHQNSDKHKAETCEYPMLNAQFSKPSHRGMTQIH